MALKKIEEVKEDFEKNAGGIKTLKAPKGPRVRKLSDPEATYFKGLFFGPTGSGKSRTILGLVLHGLKVFVISTDIGGEGLATVELELRRMGRQDLLENITVVVLSTYEEVDLFVNDPTKIYSSFYDEGFSFIFWDGFSGFQQNALSDYIAKMTPVGGDSREISDGREAGLVFEQTDWGAVKTGTLRNLDKFLKLYNLKTGEVYNKIVTCLEGIKSTKTGTGTNAQTVYVETKEPMLQGAAQKLIGPAFDLIINTRIVSPEGKEDGRRSYKYICRGHDEVSGAKTRGLDLPAVMDGDMYKLWGEIATQKGIKKGAVSGEFEKEKEESVRTSS